MTYTILAIDRASGVLGVACATGGHACGAVVPAIDPAVGAVASQAWVEPSLRRAVLSGMRSGATPDQAVADALADDPGARMRQVAALDLDGRSTVRTGDGCTDWAGHLAGDGWVALGNHLTGAQVLARVGDSMTRLGVPDADALGELYVDAEGVQVQRRTPGAIAGLARTLLSALRAGEEVGGDSRGPRSAALLVARVGKATTWPPDLDIDLRVDEADDPVGALEGLLGSRLTGPQQD